MSIKNKFKSKFQKLPGSTTILTSKARFARKADEKRLNKSYKLKQFGMTKSQPSGKVSIIISPTTDKSCLSNVALYSDHEIIQADMSTPDEYLTSSLNRAAAKATGNYLLFIHHCTRVTTGFIDHLLAHYMELPDAGAIAPVQIYEKLSENEKHKLRSYKVHDAGYTLVMDNNKKYHDYVKVSNNNSKDINIDTNPSAIEVDGVHINGLMISRELFNSVGGFDTAYNNSYYDADLCLTLKMKGLKNYCIKSTMLYKNYAQNLTKKQPEDIYVFRGKWQYAIASGYFKQDAPTNTPLELNDKEIDILGSMPDDETAKFWGDLHYANALAASFTKLGYKANVVARHNWYNKSTAKYVIVLRGLYPYYKSVITPDKVLMTWTISHPDIITRTELERSDYIFYASKLMQQKFTDKYKLTTPSDVLQQCTDPNVMKCTEGNSKSPELLFIGNSRRIFRPVLKDLLPTEHELHVYGRHWDEFPEVQAHVIDKFMDNDKVGQAYHDAQILLNDHWDDMREYGIISNRIFDALAVGAFVITDHVADMEDTLRDCLVSYTDAADLKNKIDYYLANPDARDVIAQKGKETVLANHTFDQRAATIMQKI